MSDAMALALQRAVRAERSRIGLSQEALADRLGWSRQAIVRVETGTRAIAAHELPDLCRALECSFAALLVRVPREDRAALGV